MTGLNYVRNLAGGFLDDACRRVLAQVGAYRRMPAQVGACRRRSQQPGLLDRRALRAPRRGSTEDVFCLICRRFMALRQQAAILGP